MSELASCIYKVEYHGGQLFALVEAATPEDAVTIAKAHREAKDIFGGTPPKSVREDVYDVTIPTERDLAWARECRLKVLTNMPVKNQKGRPRSRKASRGTKVVEGAKRAVRAILEVA